MNDPLTQGREACHLGTWESAYQSLEQADRATPLDARDLERLATAAYLTGRDTVFLDLQERAWRGYQAADEPARAARCAFWLALTLLLRGDVAQANGWLARGRRAVTGVECAEQGYLLLPAVELQLAGGDVDAARAAIARAVELGQHFSDNDLVACARHLEGRLLLGQGRVEVGMALLDEVMLAVVGGELTPIVTGLMYCSVIAACQRVFALNRAREWTAALGDWCGRQPEMVAFTGACLAHRAEVMQFHGDWAEALAEAERASRRATQGGDPEPTIQAHYRQGEIHRLRGNFTEAEQAYRETSRLGGDPQPGLALLRLAQGHVDTACATIRRTLDAVTDDWTRLRLLPACTEILLAAGHCDAAITACVQLEALAKPLRDDPVQAMAGQARGAVEQARGNASTAFVPLRHALELWHRCEAPYEAARTRVLIARACSALGDEESARLERDAARVTFERLGAAPDLDRLDAPSDGTGKTAPQSVLTPREAQILRLVASGKTNKAIALELNLSERTIDRHVSNILTKLNVPSRAAATAYAYDHHLL